MKPNNKLEQLLRKKNKTDNETHEMYALIGAHVLSMLQEETFKFKWNGIKYTLERKDES